MIASIASWDNTECFLDDPFGFPIHSCAATCQRPDRTLFLTKLRDRRDEVNRYRGMADGVVGAVKSFMALCTVWPKPQAVGMMTTIQAIAMRMGEDFFTVSGATAMRTPDARMTG